MIRDFIANYRAFEKYNASLVKIIDNKISKLTVPMQKAADPESRQDFLDCFWGESPVVVELKNKIRIIGANHNNVLITGASGTGKELIAQAIHFLSSRSQEPYSPINCATLSDERYAADLFGHEKGAYTDAQSTRIGVFENSGKGTVFLDEIGELSLNVQAGLLRTLQEKTITRVGGSRIIPIDCRIIVATNKDLSEAMEAGAYRRDLYYRLTDGLYIHSPVLAERGEDIILLTLGLVIQEIQAERRNADNKAFDGRNPVDHKKPVTLHPSFFGALKSHDFGEGNVRELRGIIKRAMLHRNDNILTADDYFSNVIKSIGGKNTNQKPPNPGLVRRIEEMLEGRTGIQQVAIEHIAYALAVSGGNYFSPDAFVGEMGKVYHDNTCRKYLRQLAAWGIVKHNGKKTSGARYLLAIS